MVLWNEESIHVPTDRLDDIPFDLLESHTDEDRPDSIDEPLHGMWASGKWALSFQTHIVRAKAELSHGIRLLQILDGIDADIVVFLKF